MRHVFWCKLLCKTLKAKNESSQKTQTNANSWQTHAKKDRTYVFFSGSPEGEEGTVVTPSNFESHLGKRISSNAIDAI